MNSSKLTVIAILLVFVIWVTYNLNGCGVEKSQAQSIESRTVATDEEVPTPPVEEVLPEETPEPETVTVWHLWYNGETGWTHERIAPNIRVDINSQSGVLELTTDYDTRYIHGDYYLKSTEEVVK